MRNVAIVVAVLVVLLVVALVVLGARRNRRRAALRERFGPEYDLAVRRGNDRRAVEQRLEALAQRRDSLEIHDVAAEERDRFARDWGRVQGGFVDDPGQAVADADGLVNAVLRSRGYPVETFDDRAALVATDHQDLVESYRAAHDTYADHLRTGTGDTERLRQALLQYREVFERLNQAGERPEPPRPRPSQPEPESPPAPAVEARPEPAAVEPPRSAAPADDVAAVRIDAPPAERA